MLDSSTPAYRTLLETFSAALDAGRLWIMIQSRVNELRELSVAERLDLALQLTARLRQWSAHEQAVTFADDIIASCAECSAAVAMAALLHEMAECKEALGRWQDAALTWERSLAWTDKFAGPQTLVRADRLQRLSVALTRSSSPGSASKSDAALAAYRTVSDFVAAKNILSGQTQRSTPSLHDKEAADHSLRYVLFASRRAVRIAAPERPIRMDADLKSERSKDLQWGVCLVTLPHDRMFGALSKPSLFQKPDKQKHIVVEAGALYEYEVFKGILKSKIERSRQKEILLFVHGFKTSAHDAVRRAAQLGEDLDIDGAIAAYLWPTSDLITDYVADQNEITGQAVKDVADLLETLLGASADGASPPRIHIIGHSMGCRIVAQSMQRLALMRGPDQRDAVFKHVMFAAPDMDVDDFRARVSEAACLASDVTLYGSTNDAALTASAKFHRDLPRAGSAANLLVDGKWRVVDASDAPGGVFGWGHDYYAVGAIEDMRAMLWLNLPPERRAPLLAPSTHDDGTVWRMMRCTDTDAWLALRDAMALLRSAREDPLSALRSTIETLQLEKDSTMLQRAFRAKAVTERLLAGESPLQA